MVWSCRRLLAWDIWFRIQTGSTAITIRVSRSNISHKHKQKHTPGHLEVPGVRPPFWIASDQVSSTGTGCHDNRAQIDGHKLWTVPEKATASASHPRTWTQPEPHTPPETPKPTGRNELWSSALSECLGSRNVSSTLSDRPEGELAHAAGVIIY